MPFNLSSCLAKMQIGSGIIFSVENYVLGKRGLQSAKGFGVNTEYIIVNKGKETGFVDVVHYEYKS